MSPYLTTPFYEVLRESREEGVPVTVFAPEVNNWKVVREYTSWEVMRSDIELWLYQKRMTRLKAILIDERFLVVGSSNSDYLGYLFYEEVLAVISDEPLISDFKNRVILEDFRTSRRFSGELNHLKARHSQFSKKSLKYLSLFKRFY